MVSAGSSALSGFGVRGKLKKLSNSSTTLSWIPAGLLVRENDLEEHFSKFGNVSQVHLVVDKDRKRSKGIAYVLYTLPESAARAFQELTIQSSKEDYCTLCQQRKKIFQQNKISMVQPIIPKCSSNGGRTRRRCLKQVEIQVHGTVYSCAHDTVVFIEPAETRAAFRGLAYERYNLS